MGNQITSLLQHCSWEQCNKTEYVKERTIPGDLSESRRPGLPSLRMSSELASEQALSKHSPHKKNNKAGRVVTKKLSNKNSMAQWEGARRPKMRR